MKKCTEGLRHSWAWVKNTTNAQVRGRGFRLSLRGIYQCSCGEKKLGEPNHLGQNPLNEFVAAMAGASKA